MAKDIVATQARTSDGFAEQRPISAAARGGKLPSFGERTRMFFLGAHPSSWQLVNVEGAPRIVPMLKRLIVQPGVWTRTAPKGQTPDPSLLLAKHERAGFTVLRDTDSYLYEIDGADNTHGFFLKWEKVRTYEDGAHEIVIDEAAGCAFRASLVVDGIVRPPREGVLSEMRSRLVKARQRAQRRKDEEGITEAAKRLTEFDEAVAAMKPKSSKAVA